MTLTPDSLAERLRALWSCPVEVLGLHRLSGGASRETWSFDARTHDATYPLILRRDPEGQPRPQRMAMEGAAFRAARAAGVPVPELYDQHDSALGTPYLMMRRLAGETIPRRLLREDGYAAARSGLAETLGRLLARIHGIDPDGIAELPRVDALDDLTGLYDKFGEPRPAVQIGLRWLAEHRPPASGDAVVHGDFRTGNLLIGTDGVRAVLDWELVHRGDPMEDLGWLCTKAWRFGSPHPCGGFGSREELLAGYAAEGGAAPTLETLYWWEVYGTVRWALICRDQAERHLSGAEPSVELAVLGRKVCEQEHDILLALGLTEPEKLPDPLDTERDAATRPHDLPGEAGLLRAVGDFLTEIVSDADPRRGYQARVAANAVRIARREALLGAEHAGAHRARLAGLGCADDDELCAAIRHGSLDGRRDDVVAAVRASVRDKLLVANPAHLAVPGA
jgi:aminoglycoside phosphotransferase (APT) family kinase protein